MFAANCAATRSSPIGRWTYGVEWYHDDVDSFLQRDNPRPGDQIQGPIADDATYDLAGAADALRYVEAGHSRGKVVITV